MSCAQAILATMDAGRVLDAGCGNGRSTRLLADGFGRFRTIVGIDPDKDSLDEAKKQTDDSRITYRLRSVSDLDLTPRFETCAIAYALHHVEDPADALESLVSLLLPGGYLVVTEPICDGLTPAQEIGRDVHHFKSAIDRLKGVVHRQTYRGDEIRAMVHSSGVEIQNECCEMPADSSSSEERVNWALKFLQEYLSLLEGQADHAKLSAAKLDLDARISSVGLDSPSNIFIVARKV